MTHRFWLAGAALLLNCAPAPALPLLRLIASDYSFAVPAEISAGLTRVRLVNQGSVWHDLTFIRLEDSATVAKYLAAAQADTDFPPGAFDLGGPGMIVPGDSSEAILSLPPGRYALVCWTEAHVRRGMIVPLTVTDAKGPVPAPPPADGEIVLDDFTFRLFTPIQSGPRLLRVINRGTRVHELSLYRLAKGRTAADFLRWDKDHTTPPPIVPAGGVASMIPGREIWFRSDLPAGRYIMVCSVPEGATEHSAMGMIQEFTIP